MEIEPCGAMRDALEELERVRQGLLRVERNLRKVRTPHFARYWRRADAAVFVEVVAAHERLRDAIEEAKEVSEVVSHKQWRLF